MCMRRHCRLYQMWLAISASCSLSSGFLSGKVFRPRRIVYILSQEGIKATWCNKRRLLISIFCKQQSSSAHISVEQFFKQFAINNCTSP